MNTTRQYKYYDLLMVLFVTSLLCSNLIAAGKIWSIGDMKFSGGILFFPLAYLFGDIFTEVYGYARSRRAVWAGFGAMAFASFMSWVVLALPPAPGWENQGAYELIFGSTPRIIFASMFAYFCGEFCNSYVIAKLKVATEGKFFFLRAIGSTIVGEGVDTLIFYPLAFYGLWENDLILSVMFGNYCIKVGWEVVAFPITKKVVGALKRSENEDYYDRSTNFTPFSLQT